MNDQNEKVGTIEDIIIGKDKVLFAVLQVGGFLHIGGRMVAVPFQSLVLDETGSKIKLPGATQEALQSESFSLVASDTLTRRVGIHHV